jgi:hypothetical protein
MLAEEIWEPGTATGAGATALELGDYYHPRAAALGIGFGSLLLLPLCVQLIKTKPFFPLALFAWGLRLWYFFCFVLFLLRGRVESCLVLRASRCS